MTGLAELEDARPAYDEAWSYWRAAVPEVFVSGAWRRVLARSSGRFRVNIAKLPIVALADRLRVTGVVATGPDGQKDEAADALLQERVWLANKLGLQTKRLIRNTLIFGDSYWYVWPDDADLDGPAQTVRIAYNDPRTVRVVYDQDDELTIAFAVKSWQDAGQVRATVLYPDRIERGWVLRDPAKAMDAASWERQASSGDLTMEPFSGIDIPNPYGRVPIFHFRTDMPFGTPEHEDMYGAQDAIQKFASTLTYTGERAGLRDRYLLTDINAALNGNSADNPDWDDDGDADEDTRDNSRLRTGPGEISVYEGIKEVGEWSAAEPQGFTDPADWFLRYSTLISRVSSRYADPGGQHPSGQALRVADAPEASKTEDRQEYLDADLSSACEFALRILGVEDARVAVRWKPSGLVDDLEAQAIVAAKIANGIPAEVAFLETGLYEPETVRQWLTDSQVEMDVARRIGLLSDFAGAVSQLAQGMSMGLLDEAQAREVVQLTVAQLTPQVEGDDPA
jgi:hypothetical protein